jgi:hypothetical protein
MGKFKHGTFNISHKMPHFYLIWIKMRQSCYNLNHRAYPKVGGKGIKICKLWDEFKNFRDDMLPVYLEARKQFGKDVFFVREDINKDFNSGNCTFYCKQDFYRAFGERNAKNFVLFNGKIRTAVSLNKDKSAGYHVGWRLRNNIPKEYLTVKKLPYHLKKHVQKINDQHEFFKKNKEEFAKIGGRNFELLSFRFSDKLRSGAEVAKRFGLTTQRVFQISERAFKQVKEILYGQEKN